LTTQEASDLARLQAQHEAMKETVDELKAFVNDARLSLAEIKGQLQGALAVSQASGKIAGRVLSFVGGVTAAILGLLAHFFWK
jgi:CHASE3 domain sensor protein